MTKKENSSFISFPNQVAGVIMDDSEHELYPIKYYNVIDGNGLVPHTEYSYYIYMYSGVANLNSAGRGPQILNEGMFASIHGKFSLDCYDSKPSKAIVIEVICDKGVYKEDDFSAYFLLGGPLESKGRLKYIDGCTDSLLLAPVKKGNPCFNHLHFPENIDQTQHTHPSHRIGMVTSGYGECITPFGKLPLTKDMIFVIKEWDGKSYSIGLDGREYPHGQHAFKTYSEKMNVVAFHPDSDFGATDEVHPMINRTIVDGKKASEIEEIRTK